MSDASPEDLEQKSDEQSNDLSSVNEVVKKNENCGNNMENMFLELQNFTSYLSEFTNANSEICTNKTDEFKNLVLDKLFKIGENIMESSKENKFCDFCNGSEMCNTLKLHACLVATCKWFGSWDKLYEHYVSEHEDLVLGNLHFKIDTDNLNSKHYLMKCNDEIFILHIYLNKLQAEVYISLRLFGHLVNLSKYLYQVSLFDFHNSITYGMAFHESKLQYDNHMKLNKNTAIKIKINKVKEKLEDSKQFLCKVFINNLNELHSYENNKIEVANIEEFDEEIMKKIECPICLVYMIPSIDQCSQGHSICTSCKTKVSNCPVCRNTFTGTRNYLLEEMTEHLNYPCKYRKYHCYNLFSVKHIRKHEQECMFKPFDCPTYDKNLKCAWKGELQSLPMHIREKHNLELLETGAVNLYIDTRRHIIFNHKRIFKMFYVLDKDNLRFTVQLVGPASDAANFTYKIEFSNEEKKEHLVLERYCAPLNTFLTLYVLIPISMLISFKNDKNVYPLKYKIEEVLH